MIFRRRMPPPRLPRMSFDVAAEAYDRFMGQYSAPLAEVFADFAQLPEGGRALDVGCGTGALTSVLARRYGESEVAAVDPSASFVDAVAKRLPWADVRHGHAEDLPFDDHVFAATLAELVVHFMADPIAGVREMRRVTHPGGVIAACVWDFQGGRAPQSRFFAALREATGSRRRRERSRRRRRRPAGGAPRSGRLHRRRRGRSERHAVVRRLRRVVGALHARRRTGRQTAGRTGGFRARKSAHVPHAPSSRPALSPST